MNSTTYSYQNVIDILKHLPENLQQEIADFAEFVAQKYNSKRTVVEEAEEIYKLSNAQKKAISKGLGDLKNKKVVSDAQTNERIDVWLKK